MTYPVKYMILEAVMWPYYKIIDTSYEGQGKIVAKIVELDVAHLICKHVNELEGYRYDI